MFVYTRAYFKKLISDIKTVNYCFNILSPIIYIAYLLYAMTVSVGFLWLNVSLLIITASYLVFYLISYDLKNKTLRTKKRLIRHIYKAVKLSASALTLAITVYGVYNASSKTTAVSVLLCCFMAIIWLVSLTVELLTYYIEYQSALFLAALEADKDNLMKPVSAVGNFVKRVVGKEPEPKAEPNKILRVLDKTVEEIKRKKKDKKRFGFFGEPEQNENEDLEEK